jgi:putative serine protease PepD
MTTTPRAVIAVVALLTLAGCANAPGAPANAPALGQASVSVVAKVLPSVVQITTGRGLGSGIVMDDKGDIVTNAHVVGQARTFQVRLPGSPAPVPATLVGSYPPNDLAVIHLDRLPSPAPKPAHFGNSDTLRIGDIVLAMGNPLGLTGSVTNGIVSATGRTVSEPTGPGLPGATLPDVIQTSASINPGNSGGALVDQAGDIAGQLIAHDGHVINSHRAALGIGVLTVIDQDGQPVGAGVGTLTPGGPAANAGVRVGEVITAVNGITVHSARELATVLAGLVPGQQVPVVLSDPDGGTRTVTITLGQLPGS